MWYRGYPVHRGKTESSMNFATLYAQENGIVPDQDLLRAEWLNFVDMLLLAGFHLHIVPFPDNLNRPDSLYHDAVFIRDAGLMYRGIWIKSRFSVVDRALEGEHHTELIARKFHKTILTLPEGAYLEGGDVNFFETEAGSYYFGGLSRSNQAGHDFVRQIIQPDHYVLVDSEGYHLDTVFTPVIDVENRLCALIVTAGMMSDRTLGEMDQLDVPILECGPLDSSGEGEKLGQYAINALVAPGILVNSAAFETGGIEEELSKLEICRFVAPLTSFRYAGGSVHCLTNEIYS